MEYSYIPRGVCSTKIDFKIEDNKIKDVQFRGGCNGNLQALSRLVDGLPVEEVEKKLSGIRCGFKSTSCADQLTRAIKEAVSKSEK